jgi:branched-subunit amino acid aminotransferase/4-amino-4-deoxychorismate lyase
VLADSQTARGPYTAMRTWQRRRVVDWNAHVARLAESAAMLAAAYPCSVGRDGAMRPLSPMQVAALLQPLVRVALASFAASAAAEDAYGRVAAEKAAAAEEAQGDQAASSAPPPGYMAELLLTVVSIRVRSAWS